MSEQFTPGLIFTKDGRFWRVRLKHEDVRDDDYHLHVDNKLFDFSPNYHVYEQAETNDSYNKDKFNHIHEVESYLIGEMLNAKARQEIDK